MINNLRFRVMPACFIDDTHCVHKRGVLLVYCTFLQMFGTALPSTGCCAHMQEFVNLFMILDWLNMWSADAGAMAFPLLWLQTFIHILAEPGVSARSNTDVGWGGLAHRWWSSSSKVCWTGLFVHTKPSPGFTYRSLVTSKQTAGSTKQSFKMADYISTFIETNWSSLNHPSNLNHAGCWFELQLYQRKTSCLFW